MNIKIKNHKLVYKGYKLKCSIGKSGIITPSTPTDRDLAKKVSNNCKQYFNSNVFDQTFA